jgi:type VI secretion system secreted protein VgrG
MLAMFQHRTHNRAKLRLTTWLVIASGLVIGTLLLGIAYQPSVAQAQSSLLGTAQRFAVLGGSTVTNTGATTVNRDLGVSPGTQVTGFPPGIVTGGSIHAADAVASQAQADVTNAYNVLAGEACNVDLTGQDMGGMTLIEGVYCFSTSAQLTGALTLDAQGNSAARFVFQIGSTLTTASSASVLMIGGSPCNVFWQVGSSATIGTTTRFVGNLLALTSITLNTGASLNGRALAQNGAVTMDTNSVSAASCTPAQEPEEPTATPETPTATPETPTATPETPAPGTSTPVTPTPGQPTPVIPAPGEPTPITPAPGQPTPVNPGPTTPTPVTPAPGQPSPSTPTPGTATPALGTPTQTPGTPGTPGAPTPVTPVGTSTTTPVTATPVTPTAPGGSTRTPTSTATAIATVSFTNTGSGGMSATQTNQPTAFTNLALGLAIVVLMTGGLGFVVQRRRR